MKLKYAAKQLNCIISAWELNNGLIVKEYKYKEKKHILVEDHNLPRELSEYMYNKLNSEYHDVVVGFTTGYAPHIVTDEIYFDRVMEIIESIDVTTIPNDPSMDFRNFW
jgi:ferredoxin-fold anticodon binding domain-containing protein